MKKRTVVWVLIGLGILTLGFSFGTLKSSSIENFPIPIIAQIEETHSDQSISYTFVRINRLYLKQIRLKGWKEIDQMGSLITFEKNDKKVDVITFQNGFQINRGSDRIQNP